MIRRVLLLGLVLSGLVTGSAHFSMARADDPKPGDQTATTEGETIKSKAEKAAPIPDFAGAYGLPFESLQTLGSRLADARYKGDPIALAMLGTELAVAEKVSGKKAALSSEAVIKEATDLAKMRRLDTELAALALIIKDQAIAKELQEMGKEAQKEEAERVAKFKSGERDRGVQVLEIINDTPHRLHIRVNGEHVHSLNPYSVENVHLHPKHHRAHQLWLSAHDNFGNEFKAHVVTGQHHHWTWNLTP